MTLERRNPLPVGSYWVDVFGDKVPLFDGWLTAMHPIGVRTEVTEQFPATDDFPARTWYKFSVTQPIAPWDAKTFGFPTVADASIKSSSDTVQRPDLPLDPLTRLGNWIQEVETNIGGTLGKVVPYAVIGGVAYAGYLLLTGSGLFKKSPKRKKRNE